ncbi:hypothetical protein ElyMa_000248500 [Elysia marginata]|uniref:Uncharacterized protein n=1 Tax=Elysia marginata TaxID=1093978 RepID=A0AAV4F3C0_9GAST|nr:hypothetical protein ElyMa_000248500 [Elysia marginata]
MRRLEGHTPCVMARGRHRPATSHGQASHRARRPGGPSTLNTPILSGECGRSPQANPLHNKRSERGQRWSVLP